MGIKWTAKLRVEFEMMDDQPTGLERFVLTRVVNQFRRYIEGGREIATPTTGVKLGSAKVEIVSQGPA
jgi:hypothetical protein